ncbi:PGAP1-like alpha/beta domain-containing protein [Roseimarinus sediminis]|uniref:PGAP1-like alpha/beta domain-containing protein n=1 Tax=Roseimarinus sediminis TaxID=1610899 RepID=UPI003D248689
MNTSSVKYIQLIITLLFITCLGPKAWGNSTQGTVSESVSIASLLAADSLLYIEDVAPELSSEGRKPLLLIHGWSFDGRPAPPGGGYWDHFKQYLLNDATLRASFKPYYVKYWSNAVSVNELSALLRAKVEAEGFNEQKIVIIAHSMGGLVARSYMNEQVFTEGSMQGEACGLLVDRLITLGTPHHGSPMANGPARDAKVDFLLQVYLSMLESLVFSETTYQQVNRSDLRWDNYDQLLDYSSYPDEKNQWLEALNLHTRFDERTICYTASIEGENNPFGASTLEEQYQLGAYIIKSGFSLENDGIVPLKSAAFDGHEVLLLRHFDNYNHADIIRGKENKSELFDPIKSDLSTLFPLQLTWPAAATLYLENTKAYTISWKAPSSVSKVNLYFSSDGGVNYQLLAEQIDAASESYLWQPPAVNAKNCLIKITNAEYENEKSIAPTPFTLFHNAVAFTHPINNQYFVYDQINKIEWEYEGIADEVRISYRDAMNNDTLLIADHYRLEQGNNALKWAPDTALLPSNEVYIDIELLVDDSFYATGVAYQFSSTAFHVLGEPSFTLKSPESNPVDVFGIEGEKLLWDQLSNISWNVTGEIKYVEFWLCDSLKNKVAYIDTEVFVPRYELSKASRWYVPKLYGDQFYLLARAGKSKDEILIEQYADYTFRINRQTEIIAPSADEANVPLYPCFTARVKGGADFYHFALATNQAPDQFLWEIKHRDSSFCTPTSPDYELLPGESYVLTAWASVGDTVTTYPQRLSFSSAQVAPEVFSIISPTNGDSLEADLTEVSWERSVGANGYQLTLSQYESPVQSINLLGSIDTVATIDLTHLEHYVPANISITALNDFGSTEQSLTITRKFKTGVQYPIKNYEARPLVYPNPLINQGQIEFTVSTLQERVIIGLYQPGGKLILTIIDEELTQGRHTLPFDVSSIKRFQQKGVYFLQLRTETQVRTEKLIIQ